MVQPADAAMWQGMLEGILLSGLRLGETLEIGWDLDDLIFVDLAGRYPCLRILAEAEKGIQDQQLPITPDFAKWLLDIPVEERQGKVFEVAKRNKRLDSVSKVISKIGKEARVVVNKEQNKFASAHDFRRAYGTRWATKIQPAILRELMRHASVETTLKYYIGLRGDEIAKELWGKLAKQEGAACQRIGPKT